MFTTSFASNSLADGSIRSDPATAEHVNAIRPAAIIGVIEIPPIFLSRDCFCYFFPFLSFSLNFSHLFICNLVAKVWGSVTY